jgi:membrane protease YdiL (CAAX protease family)
MQYLADSSVAESWAILLAWVGVAIAIAAVSGVFVPRKIHRPDRWSPDEPPGVFAAVCAYGLLGFLLPTIIYQLMVRNPTGSAATIPQRAQLILNCVCPVAAFVAMLVGSKLIRGEGNRRVGFSPKNIPRGFVIGVVAIIVAWPIVQLTGDLSEAVYQLMHKTHEEAHELLEGFKNTPSSAIRWTIVLSAIVIAPIAEETFFRAFFQTWLRAWTKLPWLAVLLSATLFAYAHPWWMRPPIFVLGLCLGYLYERTGNLWANIFLHALFNTISFASYWWFIIHGG